MMMSALENKIDFVALVAVHMANSNGDPLNGNRPRTDYCGFGEISDVCIKRKLRNRMQDQGQPIFVQSADRCDDGCDSLSTRASAALKGIKDIDEYAAKACELWTDVRAFGQVFAFKAKDGGVSVGVRGPVSIHQAVSVSPVEIVSMQITKSVNGEPSGKGGRSSDTMGSKHMVRFGLYEIKGAINVQLAKKTGFSASDADLVKECLRTLFENDASSARPEGSMEVCRLYWWQHNCPTGQYSSARVHRSVHVTLNDGIIEPTDFSDYTVTLDELPDLTPEILEGE
jgi:CRISPR-associated protein Csd2